MSDFLREFERFGRVVKCEFPVPRDRSQTVLYAFVEYDDQMDAYEALKRLDGKVLFRERLKIEYAKGSTEQRSGDRSASAHQSRRPIGDNGSNDLPNNAATTPDNIIKDESKNSKDEVMIMAEASNNNNASTIPKQNIDDEYVPTEY